MAGDGGAIFSFLRRRRRPVIPSASERESPLEDSLEGTGLSLGMLGIVTFDSIRGSRFKFPI
jgi:hypothetical protein